MNSSSLNFSYNINEERFFYDNYFDENDEKSRIFEDVEKDLTEKLEVRINKLILLLNIMIGIIKIS